MIGRVGAEVKRPSVFSQQSSFYPPAAEEKVESVTAAGGDAVVAGFDVTDSSCCWL